MKWRKGWLWLTLLAGMMACQPETGDFNNLAPTPTEFEENVAHIAKIEFDRSFFHPGEEVHLTVHVLSETREEIHAQMRVFITHLAEEVDQLNAYLTLAEGDNTATVSFKPPELAPRGYGVDLQLLAPDGRLLNSSSSAFDVLTHWTQTPRYGFLSDFPPDRNDIDETIALLTRYHINALQFYDWMYRHEQSLTDEEPYVDLLDRRLSLATVKRFIDSAHQRNIAAMPYTAVYGASMEFYRQHPDWALLQSNGEPVYFGNDYLVIMDIRPGSPWVAHMMDQFDQILRQTAFDGIHLDQYGDPKVGLDVSTGGTYGLAEPLAEFIDETKAHVSAQRTDGAVVFNAVTNWPIESVAPAEQDIVYIEVWPPYRWFSDLHSLIVQAQSLGNGKAVVLAAYMDPKNINNVLLVDAVIFASGGGHIELGETNAILADAYFPKYEPVGESLTPNLQRYYDFAVRYQDLIGPRTKDATQEFTKLIEIRDGETGEQLNTANNAVKNKIWPIVRSDENTTAISLINLLGLENAEWKEAITVAPTVMGQLKIQIRRLSRKVSGVWFASPDETDMSLQPLKYQEEDGGLIFNIPALIYWDLIVIEWEEGTQ